MYKIYKDKENQYEKVQIIYANDPLNSICNFFRLLFRNSIFMCFPNAEYNFCIQRITFSIFFQCILRSYITVFI